MSGKELPSAYEQLQIRFRELSGRAMILTKFKLAQMVAKKELFEESPTNENCRALVTVAFEHGLEFGQLRCDIHWVSSLMEMGFSSEKIMEAWNRKDEKQRQESEEGGRTRFEPK